MQYPLISEYIEAIRFAEDNFDKLSNLRPVLDSDGNPVMSSGNFAVVFKMKDIETDKLYAVKCFTREQEEREERYREIIKVLEQVKSPYFVSTLYYEKELFVDTSQGDEMEFPVLLMDWVEGYPIDQFIKENISNKLKLSLLAYNFCQLGTWLLSQPIAHGDIKPDNILIKDDFTLVLVDYDGMYVPAFDGKSSLEIGSPDFQHPNRSIDSFNRHIDDKRDHHDVATTILIENCLFSEIRNIGLLWAKVRRFCLKSTDVLCKEVRCFGIPVLLRVEDVSTFFLPPQKKVF